MSIHDRARALSLSRGITMTAAYAELSRRAAAVRRAKRRLCQVPAGGRDLAMIESPQRQWLPYSDN